MLYLKTASGRTEPDEEAPDGGSESSTETNKVSPPQTETVLVNDRETLLRLEEFITASRSRQVFLDTETTGLDPYTSQLVLIQIMAGHKVFLLEVDEIQASHDDELALRGCIQEILKDRETVKVFHNAKFDLKFLKLGLYEGQNLEIRNLFDTYLCERLLTAGLSRRGDHSLEYLARKHLGIELDKSLQQSFKTGASLSPEQIKYAAQDVKVLGPIFKKQASLLVEADLVDVAVLEFSIIPAVTQIELSGMLLDKDKLDQLKTTYTERLAESEKHLKGQISYIPATPEAASLDVSKVNFRSPVQVKKILHLLGHKVESTATENLERINHPFAREMIEHRRVSKLLSSFIEKLPRHVNEKTGRIHPEFLQLGTDAGRFSCQRPNLQQIPRDQEWRDLFVAPPGYKIITADYSQIELRILAEYSQDPALLEVFRDGQDLHTRTISNMLKTPLAEVTKEQRQIAKTINFGLCYGMSASGLARELNISVQEAEESISSYFRAYPEVKKTLQRLGMQAVSQGYSKTLLKRKRYYKRTDSFAEQKSLERKGRNTPIQGTCGDILKRAIQYLTDALPPYKAKIIHLVHDEIVLEVEERQAEQVKEVVQKAMVQAGSDLIKSVPVKVGVEVANVWRK